MSDEGFSPGIGAVGPGLDFFLEVSKGNVAGHSSVNVIGRHPQLGGVIEDIYDPGGTLVYPTAGEQWEVVSDSPNDTLLGTGARQVRIEYQDDNYTRQVEEIIDLNGTTPVLTAATDMFRHEHSAVIAVGSSGHNEGTILIRAAGGGDNRGGMLPLSNGSLDGHYTVPAGVTSYLVGIYQEINKNEDVDIDYLKTEGDNGIFKLVLPSTIYQSSSYFPFRLAAGKLLEKSDFKAVGSSSNLDARPAIIYQMIEVLNV